MVTKYGFSEEERSLMLSLDGVGETVIKRIEQVGFSSLSQLSNEDVHVVTKQISEMMRSSCWHNSPQAKGAIQAIIDLAKTAED